MFAQPLVPFQNAAGELCAWSSLNGDVDAANDTVCVNITLAVGLEEQALAPLRIWPVPAQDVLFLDGLPSGLQRVEVYDMTGALRLVRALRPGRMLDRIPVTELPPGAYVLRAIGEGGTLNGRFTVQR